GCGAPLGRSSSQGSTRRPHHPPASRRAPACGMLRSPPPAGRQCSQYATGWRPTARPQGRARGGATPQLRARRLACTILACQPRQLLRALTWPILHRLKELARCTTRPNCTIDLTLWVTLILSRPPLSAPTTVYVREPGVMR